MTYNFQFAKPLPGQTTVQDKLLDTLQDLQEPYLDSNDDSLPYLFSFDAATATLSFHESVNKDFMEEVKKTCATYLGPVKNSFEVND